MSHPADTLPGMEFTSRKARFGRPHADRLVDVHADINRSVLALFDLVTELDEPATLLDNSVTDMATWLAFDLGVEPKTARSWVRVAHSLAELPITREAFRSGAVSLDEVRILCRYASPDNEAALLALTRDRPVGELAGAVRDYLNIEQSRSQRKRETSWLEMRWNEDESALKLWGEIPGVDGLMVETALRRVACQAPLDEYTGLYRDPVERDGEALVQIASQAAAADADHDRSTLVVHFNGADLMSGNTSGMVGSQLVDRDELLRIACDPRLQPAIDDPSGMTVGVGRTTRKIPAWLRRLVDGRDEGCRFPGCGRTRWTHAHHIVHWAKGGPTNLDNLVTLCGFHHRLVHRKGWEIRGNPNESPAFIDQWGTEYRPARSPFGSAPEGMLLDHLDYYLEYRLGRLATANSPP